MAGNGMKFFGTLEEKYEKDVNEIWAITTGDFTQDGWDSDKAHSIENLTTTIVTSAKVNQKVLLAIPTYAQHRKNFNLNLDRKEDHLKIGIFHKNAFKRHITLSGITVGPTTPGFPGITVGHEKYGAFEIVELAIEDADWGN